jgi:hypothetical protein
MDLPAFQGASRSNAQWHCEDFQRGHGSKDAFLCSALTPTALKIPPVVRLQAAITSLEAEVVRRRDAERRFGAAQQSMVVTLASIGAGVIATDHEGCVTQTINAIRRDWSLPLPRRASRPMPLSTGWIRCNMHAAPNMRP